MKRRKRRYRMRARTEAAARRADQIVEAALELFMAKPYEDVTLQSIADVAGVALKTLVRKFDSKEALAVACAHRRASQEESLRDVRPGDVVGAARVLTARYEALGPTWLRFLALEDRIAAIAKVVAIARASHRRWLATVFASALPSRGALREQRLAELFGATELYVWHSWRAHLGLGRAAATRAMTDMLEALMAHWKTRPGEA